MLSVFVYIENAIILVWCCVLVIQETFVTQKKKKFIKLLRSRFRTALEPRIAFFIQSFEILHILYRAKAVQPEQLPLTAFIDLTDDDDLMHSPSIAVCSPPVAISGQSKAKFLAKKSRIAVTKIGNQVGMFCDISTNIYF